MSFLFGGANQAARDQGLAGYQGLALTQANQGAALSGLEKARDTSMPYFLSNWGTAQQGTNALANLLGLNGAAGTQSAMANLETTPGYQFSLGQGNNAISAAAAANGTLNSGNQLTALSKFNQGLAQSTYNNAVSQLQPYLGMAQNTASGIGNLNTSIASAEAGVDMSAAGAMSKMLSDIGNASASRDISNQSQWQNLFGGGLNLLSSMGTGGLSSLFSDLSSLPSFLTSSGAFQYSDERLKEDIEPVGELYDGQAIFRYRYKDDPTTRIGLIAQDVENVVPLAVREFGGFKAVDYGKATDYASELARLREAA